MIIGEILLAILGNGAYDIIKGIGKDLLCQDDEDLFKRLYKSIEAASQHFFEKYDDRFGSPNSSFLARQKNIDEILKSIYYGNQNKLSEKISPKGFDGAPDVTPEAIDFFISELEKSMMADIRLNKIIVEKNHIKESKESNDKIIEILEQLLKQSPVETATINPRERWNLVDSAGNPIPFKEGERYTKLFQNGVKISFMIKDDTIYVEFTPPNGLTGYYELDRNGNVKDFKFPYELSEYSIDIPSTEIINKKVVKQDNGFYLEEYFLKWNRHALIQFNPNRKILGIHLEGGWYVNHREKKIQIGARNEN